MSWCSVKIKIKRYLKMFRNLRIFWALIFGVVFLVYLWSTSIFFLWRHPIISQQIASSSSQSLFRITISNGSTTVISESHASFLETTSPNEKVNTPKLEKEILTPPKLFQQCAITAAIILCEDDMYLTVKRKKIFLKEGSPPKRQKIAKDFSRQINQTLALLKSIAILTKYETSSESPSSCVNFLILSDNSNHYEIIRDEIRTSWSDDFRELVHVAHIPVRYPPGSAWMKNLFRPCATLRLFLAELLPDSLDSVLYLDTDVIFFQSVQALWSQFGRFDEKDDRKGKKVAAMAPCLVHYGTEANSVPYFGKSGLNAGVMLMNLTRIRKTQWTNKIRIVTTMFQDKIKLADQDILNIYFHFFPEELHLLSCDWNFRPFQCRRENYCEDPELTEGISALHGNALSFTPQGPEPFFHSVFQTFHRAKLNTKFTLRNFVKDLENSLIKINESTRKYNSQCKQFGELDVLLLNRLYDLIEH